MEEEEELLEVVEFMAVMLVSGDEVDFRLKKEKIEESWLRIWRGR